MRYLGIDPGLAVTGYGCVHLEPGALEPGLVEAGVFRLDARRPVPERIAALFADLDALLEELRPERVVVERLFSHARHVRTAILMGHARGAILLAAQRRSIPIDELSPSEIKRAVAGSGRATKHQMQRAVMTQCGLAEPPEPHDVADAIAIALCAARRDAGRRAIARE